MNYLTADVNVNELAEAKRVVLSGLPESEKIAQLRVLRSRALQRGAFGIGAVISVTIGIVVIGALVVALWPTITGTNTSIQALTQTDAGTTTMKAIWPIALIVIGVGIGAGLIIWAARHFGLMDQ